MPTTAQPMRLAEHEGLLREVTVLPVHADVLDAITERAVRVSGLTT